MIIEEVKLKNFLSHGDTTVSLQDGQKVLIDGASGAGKSSIVDALVWGLYGEGRSDNRSLVKKGKKSCEVQINLKNGESRFQVNRTASAAGKHTLEVYEHDGADFKPVKVSGVRYTQEYIEKHVTKASHLLFINSVICPQENTQSFIKQTAQNRKDIILEIIRASDYDEYHEKAKKFLKDKTQETELLRAELVEKESFKKDNEQLLSRKSKLREDLPAATEALECLYKEKQAMQEVQKQDNDNRVEIAKLESSVKVYESSINNTNTQIKGLEEYILASDYFFHPAKVDQLKADIKLLSEKDAILKELADQRNALAEWSAEEAKINSLKPSEWQTSSLDKEISELNTTIISLMNEAEKICPLNHTHCPSAVEQSQKNIDFCAKSLAGKEAQKKEYEAAAINWQNRMVELGHKPEYDKEKFKEISADIRKLSLAREEFDAFEAKRSEYDIKKSELGCAKRLLEDAKSKMETDTKKMSELRKLLRKGIDNEIAAIENRIYHFNSQLSAVKKELEIIAQIEPAYDKAVARIDEIGKLVYTINEDISAVAAVKEAFGNSGIKSIMVDYVLPELEGRINDVLEKMSDFRITIETQKDSADGESLIDGLFLTITNGQGETFDLANYSGGEKMKINMAISEGLASLQQVGFRVLDESITGLDNSTVESFMEILETIQSRFSQLVCISHLPAVKDMFHDKIHVVKLNGDSVIK